LVTVGVAACQGLPQSTGFITTRPVDVSAGVVRIRVVELGRLFSAEIERAADSIRGISDEPSIRRHALQWKMYAIPAAHEAVLLPDPALSILDVWAFALQMEEYFDRGAGQNVFGPHQSIALDAVRRLDSATLEQALLVSDSTADEQRARNTLNAFVEQYPILGPQFGRASLGLEFADLLGSDATTAVAAVGDINQAVGEITNRLAFHNEYLMKQASWAALEILEDLIQDTLVTGTLASAMVALENASALAEELPALVEGERIAVIEALDRELAVLLESLNEQRSATLALFSDELRFMIDALVRERVLVGEGVSAEVVATIEAITPLVQEAIDQAFFRATQLIIAISLLAVVLVGIVTFGLLRYSRSPGPSRGSGPSPDSRS
jgi:hypothetical protein